MLMELMCTAWILQRWRENPQTPKRGYTFVYRWQDGSPENELPLTADEVARYKAWMRENALLSYYSIFPEELQ